MNAQLPRYMSHVVEMKTEPSGKATQRYLHVGAAVEALLF